MATVVCARCSLEFEVIRTGRTETRARMDLPSFMLRCVHRKDATLRADDLTVRSLTPRFFLPSREGWFKFNDEPLGGARQGTVAVINVGNSSVITVARLSMAVAMSIAWRNPTSRSIL
jgi:hypothetical protein